MVSTGDSYNRYIISKTKKLWLSHFKTETLNVTYRSGLIIKTIKMHKTTLEHNRAAIHDYFLQLINLPIIFNE